MRKHPCSAARATCAHVAHHRHGNVRQLKVPDHNITCTTGTSSGDAYPKWQMAVEGGDVVLKHNTPASLNTTQSAAYTAKDAQCVEPARSTP